MNGQMTFVRKRPVLILDHSPYFTFTERAPLGTSKNTVLLSLPLYAKLANYGSVRNVAYERLAIRMKPRFDTPAEHRRLLDQIKNGVQPWYARYFLVYKMENTEKVD